ncbi:MFS transporter [Paenibacillus sp. CAU 1523]|uniref:MFS transporter n=2 Tax=Paenibacillus arenosi TaxID=2774142 RepID=A0ABR9AWW3_9BACL|nr:MFS transporter [Paenibacillus arenosi]
MITSQHQNKLPFVVAGLLLGILMSAMDNTIVASAMPTILADIGGAGGWEKFVWVTSAYIVATMAGMPIFGKLSDMFGRKRFYIFGLLMFLLGSMLCGTANSIEMLAVYRVIQGIGGGALVPIAFTIIFDIFPPEKRGKMTGLFGAVFGTSSVMGPLLGAYITDFWGWEWIFYINLPLGIVSFWFIMQFYKETSPTKKQQIDWAGAFTLIIAVVSLMFALETGGKTYAWNSIPIISLFVVFAVFLALFLWIETKAKEPIITFSLFKRRLFATSQCIGFLYGMIFVFAVVYIPMFVQGVYGGTATNSGLILTPMMLGSVVTSTAAGILLSRLRFRSLMIVSGILLAAGIGLLSTLSPDTPRTLMTLYMVLTGMGVGFSFSLISLASVHGMDFNQRGTANATQSFFRSLGMTLGITVFGAVQSALFNRSISQAMPNPEAMRGIDAQVLLAEETRKQIPPDVYDQLINSLADSISGTFGWILVPVVLALISIALMGGERIQAEKPERDKRAKASNVG